MFMRVLVRLIGADLCKHSTLDPPHTHNSATQGFVTLKYTHVGKYLHHHSTGAYSTIISLQK